MTPSLCRTSRTSRTSRMALALAACCALATPAVANSVTVLGTANVFGAGHSGAAATPAPAGQGGGTVAPFIALNGASMVSFTSISGVIDLGCAGGCAGGPDGQWLGSTSNLQSYNGISGMFIDRRAPLYGVFVGAGEPADPAPERLHFEANQAFASLSPLLHQTFFIGDGLTGTGTGNAQQFVVPGGATRLFLGIVDGLETGGQPGGYFNNTGEFVVTLSAVPEPASGALLLAGVATLGFLVRRRG